MLLSVINHCSRNANDILHHTTDTLYHIVLIFSTFIIQFLIYFIRKFNLFCYICPTPLLSFAQASLRGEVASDINTYGYAVHKIPMTEGASVHLSFSVSSKRVLCFSLALSLYLPPRGHFGKPKKRKQAFFWSDLSRK